MTNINCSEKCIYQKDGKCSLEDVKLQKVTMHPSCAYLIKTNKTTLPLNVDSHKLFVK